MKEFHFRPDSSNGNEAQAGFKSEGQGYLCIINIAKMLIAPFNSWRLSNLNSNYNRALVGKSPTLLDGRTVKAERFLPDQIID